MLTMPAMADEVPASRAVEGGLLVEVLPGLAAAERAWRGFEPVAATFPYGRFDWIAAYAAAFGLDGSIRVVLVRDPSGGLAALLPFRIARRCGLRIASAIGGKHANFNLPPMRPGFGAALDARELSRLMRRIGRQLGADAISIENMPTRWAGEPVALARLGFPAANGAPEVRLERDPEATALRSMTTDARKRLRNKERGLAKGGEITLTEARSPEEVDEILAAFLSQKEARFALLGIPDPFLDPSVRDFIRRGAAEGLASGRPAIELYALRMGPEIVAVLGGAADRHRLSGMFISFEDRPETTKYSPGDILVSRVIREQCARGRTSFDLGTGEARYKRTFCDEAIELVDILQPVTLQGGLFVAARAAAVAAKRQVKGSPLAMELVRRLRRIRAALPARARS